MKILHYSLGVPPSRTGGLIRYTLDLINEQVSHGDEVYYLYPGSINLFRSTHIKKEKRTYTKAYSEYTIVNSLPLPISGGIKRPKYFMIKVDKSMYINFLKMLKPDVIHVHTLMGIHKEFFESAHELGIKLIFTTHDYFGIAPEPTFFLNGKSYDECNTLNKWIEVSKNAMPTWKLRIFQLKCYPSIRKIIKKFKHNHMIKRYKQENQSYDQNVIEDFYKLQQYYKCIFSFIDIFHFNSTQTKKIFLKNIPVKKNKCISIVNKNIKQHNAIEYKKRLDTIGYIGAYREFKGFFEFLKLADQMPEKKFYIFGSNENIELPRNVRNFGRYDAKNIGKILEKIDVVIVPSMWKETFGFVVIEALSFGVRVLVSENVGAKDIVPRDFIFKKIEEVPKMLTKINKYKIKGIKTMDEHYLEIRNLYV